MAEFQWWLLLVGLVVGGGLVAVVTMDGRRREVDVADLERDAEATWITDRLAGSETWVDQPTVDAVLRLHHEYLGMTPPDELIVDGGAWDPTRSDGDPDRDTHDIRDDRGSRADEDLAGA